MKNVIKKHAAKPFIFGYRISPEEQGGYGMKEAYELIDHLVEQDLDYIHVSLDDVSSKPRGIEDGKTRLELILEHVNGRVPVIAAGSMVTADDVASALNKGLSLAAVGHTLIMNPDWVEKVQNGKEAEIKTAIKTSQVSDLELPEKLWGIIQASGPWFKIED
jgi:2,4-dienoyl-CoA reductase-like NADH-dependent reductase (Old Yellow Enzyme family)